MSLFTELRRRNVLRVGAAYIVTDWLAIQVVETVLPAFGFGFAHQCPVQKSARKSTLGHAIGEPGTFSTAVGCHRI